MKRLKKSKKNLAFVKTGSKVKGMAMITKKSRTRVSKIKELRMKADLLDEVMELIEERRFGELILATEGEKLIPLAKAKRLFKK